MSSGTDIFYKSGYGDKHYSILSIKGSLTFLRKIGRKKFTQ